jgi:hypothetical protein
MVLSKLPRSGHKIGHSFSLENINYSSKSRPVLALDRLSFLEPEGKVGYRRGPKGGELERRGYLEFNARVTSHIPEKGQVMVHYFGFYANATGAKVRKEDRGPVTLGMTEEELPRLPAEGWAEMIRKVYSANSWPILVL